jgi:hypothetical protein
MGATPWHYFIPWQADMNRALQQLREDVFRQGQYVRPVLGHLLDEIGVFHVEESRREKILEQYGLTCLRPLIAEHGWNHLEAALEQLANAPELRSMEEFEILMCCSNGDGTGSILDIAYPPSSPGEWRLFPLSEEQIQTVYGTSRPTREQIEVFGGVDGLYGRNEGIYFAVYHEGEPDLIYIEGCSGD